MPYFPRRGLSAYAAVSAKAGPPREPRWQIELAPARFALARHRRPPVLHVFPPWARFGSGYSYLPCSWGADGMCSASQLACGAPTSWEMRAPPSATLLPGGQAKNRAIYGGLQPHTVARVGGLRFGELAARGVCRKQFPARPSCATHAPLANGRRNPIRRGATLRRELQIYRPRRRVSVAAD